MDWYIGTQSKWKKKNEKPFEINLKKKENIYTKIPNIVLLNF